MYKFQPYNPATPRMVTSFKGNQKLIFEGYRYNIHHIVPAKNVKTWRCVCAKKLTSARSWCKGRAETWDNDSHGTSKGEHNHPAEHDVAELEYFKSQLILAAIEYPEASLNDLIEEATSMMSPGVTFTSRESLKKSLTVARKTAENGGFKMKAYKNSAESTGSRSRQNHLPTTVPHDTSDSIFSSPNLKLFETPTMMSILSFAKQCQETNNNNELEDSRSNPSLDDFQQSTSSASSILNQFVSGDYDEDRPPMKIPKIEENHFDETNLLASLTNVLNGNSLNSSGFASMSGLSSKDWNNSLVLERNGMDSSRSTPLSNSGYETGSNRRKNVDKAKRVNDFLNK